MNQDTPYFNTDTTIPLSLLDEVPLFSQAELDTVLAEIARAERQATIEAPVSVWVASVTLIFLSALFATGYVLVPNFFKLQAFHSLALGVSFLGATILCLIHVYGARLRAL